MLAGCDSVPDFPNRPLADGTSNIIPGRTDEKIPAAVLEGPDPEAPLILIAISGGGSRAAAVGLGALDLLAATTYPTKDRPVALIDRVKVVSSVSGGSLVAAWFGYAGAARLDELRDGFLKTDNMKTLEWAAADPITWARLSFTGYTRIDVFRNLIDQNLFHGDRFAVMDRPDAPLIIMNATDMESGEVFAFTRQRFDDVCSDRSQLPISAAVAASAAFPVALSPLSLKNYSYEKRSGCPATPAWVTDELALPAPKYVNLETYKRARYANALRNGPAAFRNEHFLHLLDGGLADNQGVTSLTEALISPHGQIGLLDMMNVGAVKRVVVISINARSDADNDVGAHESVPGLLKVVNTVIGTPIDATTARANASLTDLVAALKQAGSAPATTPGHPLFSGLNVYGIAVDFDQFPATERQMQNDVKNIGTSWTLTPAQVDEAMQAGKILLGQHPCFQRLLHDLNATPVPAPADADSSACL